MITVNQLRKEFRVVRHEPGLLGALRNLGHREYRTVRAVDDISFTVADGEVVGYIGPNGAGKSTTIKILTGILVPTSGEVCVNGRVPWEERREYVGRIGVVFGQRNTLWWDLPLVESLELLRHVYSIPADRYRTNRVLLESTLELGELLDRPVRSLSLGQMMRANLAAAFLHDPDVVFLDEPTIGLDVVAKEQIRGFIRDINAQRGTTILLTTHDLADVERLCQRVMMIDRGQLLFDGDLHELTERFGGERHLVVELAEDSPVPELEGATLVSQQARRVTYSFDAAAVPAPQLMARVAALPGVTDLSVREPEIEATIRRIYAEGLLGEG